MNLYGEGDYALSAVKVVDGTDGYVKLAEERGLCQDQESYQECWKRTLLQQGLDTCKCTPFTLRNYSKTVRKMRLYKSLTNVFRKLFAINMVFSVTKNLKEM